MLKNLKKIYCFQNLTYKDAIVNIGCVSDVAFKNWSLHWQSN